MHVPPPDVQYLPGGRPPVERSTPRQRGGGPPFPPLPRGTGTNRPTEYPLGLPPAPLPTTRRGGPGGRPPDPLRGRVAVVPPDPPRVVQPAEEQRRVRHVLQRLSAPVQVSL